MAFSGEQTLTNPGLSLFKIAANIIMMNMIPTDTYFKLSRRHRSVIILVFELEILE